MQPKLHTQLHTWQDKSDKVRPAWRRLSDGTPILEIGEFTWYGTDEEMIALRDVLLEEYALDPEEAQPEPDDRRIGRRPVDAHWQPAKNFLGVEA